MKIRVCIIFILFLVTTQYRTNHRSKSATAQSNSLDKKKKKEETLSILNLRKEEIVISDIDKPEENYPPNDPLLSPVNENSTATSIFDKAIVVQDLVDGI